MILNLDFSTIIACISEKSEYLEKEYPLLIVSDLLPMV